MKTRIIAISGRVGSGKSSLGKWLVGYSLASLGVIAGQPSFEMRDGDLYIPDLFGDVSFAGKFDHRSRTENMRSFLKENLDHFLMCFAFADELKRVCVEQFGIDPRLVYGTQVDKGEYTHLLWENMPGIITDKKLWQKLKESGLNKDLGLTYHEPGPMTSREFQQFLGTNLFRRMDEHCHVRSVMGKIEAYKPMVAFIDDLRFFNELAIVKEYEGICIRLTRKINEDTHESEAELDQCDAFDYIIDNQDYTIDQLCQEFYGILQKEGLVG